MCMPVPYACVVVPSAPAWSSNQHAVRRGCAFLLANGANQILPEGCQDGRPVVVGQLMHSKNITALCQLCSLTTKGRDAPVVQIANFALGESGHLHTNIAPRK